MLPWKLRKRQILPVNQNFSSVYFSLAKFQLVSCNLPLAMTWQMTYTHKLPKLCSATLNMWYLPDWTWILEKLRCDSKLYLWVYLSSLDWLTCFWAVTLLAAFCHCFLEPCSTDITDCSSSAFCSLSTKIRQKKKEIFYYSRSQSFFASLPYVTSQVCRENSFDSKPPPIPQLA